MPVWTDPGPQDFDAPLEATGSGGGCAVSIPLDVPALFGTRGRVPVVAVIDGVHYRGSITPYGGVHRLGVLKSIRQQIGKQAGDRVHVRLELDAAERTVEIDPEIERALGAAQVLEKFRALSHSQQREYAEWIASAKKDSTRADRVAKLLSTLRQD
jgi:hypothetical protein